ncbi:response regulator transcription factor [Streptomyces sp. RKND-216]|uniref:response regulator transcription factor n=1 Tax=Streptomyces sp. RKND-216 TaxID=2562581 RepID=UPI001FFB51B2|nr:response regulator transcription factor [Streptomyces sp. RKND-216]
MHPHEVVRCGLEAMLTDVALDVTVLTDTFRAGHRLVAEGVDVLICPCAATEEVLDLASACRERRTLVLALLESSDEQQLALASEVPADGFLLADELSVPALGDALRRLEGGEMPLPVTLSRWLLGRMREGSVASPRAERPYFLTPREREALNLLAEGLSNKQIARALRISPHGAKRHVANVIAKLNCPNRTLAVALALRDGLVDGPGSNRRGPESTLEQGTRPAATCSAPSREAAVDHGSGAAIVPAATRGSHPRPPRSGKPSATEP